MVDAVFIVAATAAAVVIRTVVVADTVVVDVADFVADAITVVECYYCYCREIYVL